MGEAKAILMQWIESVNDGNFPAVEAMYSENATLLPTFSPKVRKTPEERRAYFDSLAKHQNLEVILHERTPEIHPLGETLYSACGIYCWTFEMDEEPLHFEARFSYTLDTGSDQPILQHHSSQVPRGL